MYHPTSLSLAVTVSVSTSLHNTEYRCNHQTRNELTESQAKRRERKIEEEEESEEEEEESEEEEEEEEKDNNEEVFQAVPYYSPYDICQPWVL
jgi:hypothetical protein